MMHTHFIPAKLLLADGTLFEGYSIGKPSTCSGEICFNTGMTGYQEIFTDPSYYGQIVVCTHTHIGNYGVHQHENESSGAKITGMICREFSVDASRNLANGNLFDFLANSNVPLMCKIDTRALVRHIRSKGAMNAVFSSEILDVSALQSYLNEVPSMEGRELSSVVSTQASYTSGANPDGYRVALLDLGVKQSIIDCLTDRGCFVKVFPARSTFSEMLAFQPQGFMISNGPGDPASMDYAVETVRQILQSGIPLFGICLGHQILARALGMKTYKMFNGHRGINHPIKNLLTGKGEITSQNHGFAVVKEDLENIHEAELTHIHLNDGTVAGLRIKNGKAFSVQYHPESSPGPHDSRYLFDQFIQQMKASSVVQTN